MSVWIFFFCIFVCQSLGDLSTYFHIYLAGAFINRWRLPLNQTSRINCGFGCECHFEIAISAADIGVFIFLCFVQIFVWMDKIECINNSLSGLFSFISLFVRIGWWLSGSFCVFCSFLRVLETQNLSITVICRFHAFLYKFKALGISNGNSRPK